MASNFDDPFRQRKLNVIWSQETLKILGGLYKAKYDPIEIYQSVEDQLIRSVGKEIKKELDDYANKILSN